MGKNTYIDSIFLFRKNFCPSMIKNNCKFERIIKILSHKEE